MNQYQEILVDSNSLLAKHLTEEVESALKGTKSGSGFVLDDVVRSGIANTDSGCGVYIPDAESIETFGDLLHS